VSPAAGVLCHEHGKKEPEQNLQRFAGGKRIGEITGEAAQQPCVPDVVSVLEKCTCTSELTHCWVNLQPITG